VTVTYNVLTYKSCSVLKHIFGILAAITDADHYGRLGVTRLASTDEVNVNFPQWHGPIIEWAKTLVISKHAASLNLYGCQVRRVSVN